MLPMAVTTSLSREALRLPLHLLLLHLLLLPSCGGKEAGITTGLAGDALLGDLTAEQAAAGCARLDAQVGVRFDQATLALEQCTLFALELTSEEPPCTSLRDTCVMSRAENQPGAFASFFEPTRDVGCGDPGQQWQGCTATVRALERCLRDVLSTYADALDEYTCRDAPTYRRACLPPLNPYVAILEIDPRTNRPPECELLPVPDSCRALEQGCPGLPLFAL